MVILLAALSQPRWRAEAFKPGELATPHAQILSGKLASERCSTCHPQALTSIPGWFSKEIEGHHGVSQTDRCLDCHHATIDRPLATLAHNLPLSTRSSLRKVSSRPADQSWHDLLPSPAIDQENIQCNACHREHGGSDNDLSAVTDAQCQTCHADRFGSFATSHPDWDQWPYGRGRNISFDHASHVNKHFPATKRGDSVSQFQCADCHHRTSDNELTRVTTYERGCKSCHDQGLKVRASEGVELFALPTLPSDSVERVGRWPTAATGFFDGQIAPITELLFRANAKTEWSIRQVPQRDFSRIDGDESTAVKAAEQIAKAYVELLDRITNDGQVAIADQIVSTGVTHSSAAAFVQSLPTQLIADAYRDWFSDPNTSSSFGSVEDGPFRPPVVSKPDDDLLIDQSENESLLTSDDELLAENDLLSAADSSLSTIDNSPETQPRFDPAKMLPIGGWYRDDLRLAIRYRGGGHADPVLKSVIDMISQMPVSDPARERLLKTESISACVSCHAGVVTATGSWKSETLIGRKREFTKFTHSPHLNISQLADCVHCHQIETSESEAANIRTAKFGGAGIPCDFAPLSRQVCAGCHTPHAAGDACIKCHRYHIDLR